MSAQTKKVPLRRCAGCREMKDKKELIRVIRTAEGEILLDKTGRANGRGVYLCHSISCFDKAVKSREMSRSLKVQIPEEVYEQLREEIQ